MSWPKFSVLCLIPPLLMLPGLMLSRKMLKKVFETRSKALPIALAGSFVAYDMFALYSSLLAWDVGKINKKVCLGFYASLLVSKAFFFPVFVRSLSKIPTTGLPDPVELQNCNRLKMFYLFLLTGLSTGTTITFSNSDTLADYVFLPYPILMIAACYGTNKLESIKVRESMMKLQDELATEQQIPQKVSSIKKLFRKEQPKPIPDTQEPSAAAVVQKVGLYSDMLKSASNVTEPEAPQGTSRSNPASRTGSPVKPTTESIQSKPAPSAEQEASKSQEDKDQKNSAGGWQVQQKKKKQNKKSD